MSREDIMEKIEKLLALAGNNPSEAEAMAALTKARELMAKHNIEEAELNKNTKNTDDIREFVANVKIATEWKRRLVTLIASHFRCKCFYYTYKSASKAVFFGYENDAKVACAIFEYAAKLINRKAGNYVQRFTSKHLPTDGIKGDYIVGFMSGLKEVWNKQDAQWRKDLSENTYALVVVTPAAVTNAYADISKDFKTCNWKNTIERRFDEGAIIAGYSDGMEYANSLKSALTE